MVGLGRMSDVCRICQGDRAVPPRLIMRPPFFAADSSGEDKWNCVNASAQTLTGTIGQLASLLTVLQKLTGWLTTHP